MPCISIFVRNNVAIFELRKMFEILIDLLRSSKSCCVGLIVASVILRVVSVAAVTGIWRNGRLLFILAYAEFKFYLN